VFDLDDELDDEATPVTPEPTPEPIVEKTPALEPEPVVEEVVEEKATPTPVVESPPVEEEKSAPVGEMPPVLESKPEPVAEPKPEPVAERKPEPVAERKPEPEPKPELPQPEAEKDPQTVLDATKSDRPMTIAEKLASQRGQNPDKPTPLHQSLNGNRKIKLDEIPIHKQYQYVQKVFEGNNVRFRIIVDKVNNAQNKAEVEDILSKFVLSNGELDRNDPVVSEFLALLRNRF